MFSAPINEYMEQEQISMGSYSDLGVSNEMKSRLSVAFKTQVDWGEYDGRTAEMALGAMEAELLWLKRSVSETGSLNFYAANESRKKLQFWAAQLFGVLDKISMDGVVDTDTSLIYYFVRKSVYEKLQALTLSLNKAEANINSKASAYTVDQFKDLAENLIPFVSGVL